MNYTKKFITVVLIALLLFSGFTSSATQSEKTVVKVGFPTQSGTSYINENGDYAGYLVDYLNQLNLFTNWEIEYVQVGGNLDTQLETLMRMLYMGEIDMIGTMNLTSELEDLFIYPNYSYGITYASIAVLDESIQWIEEDFSHWDNIRIATYPGYGRRAEQLEYYAKVNDFTYEMVECSTYDEIVNAIKEGRADAMLQADISIADGFRIIGRFSPQPYYFALNNQRTDLLQQLNFAMRSLNTSQPNLQNELYDLHFRYIEDFELSETHRKYIESLGTMRILFFEGDAPYQYIKDGELTGFAVEYIEDFAEKTGMKYETVIAKTYDEAIELIESEDIDLVACIPTNSTLTSLADVRYTVPFFNSFSVTVCANEKPHTYSPDLEFRLNAELTLNEVQTKEDYAARLDYYSLTYYLRKARIYDDIVVDWANTKHFSYVIGMTDNVPDEFITVLNQYASSMSEETRQRMLYRYSSDDTEYTFGQLAKAYKNYIIATAVAIILLVIMFILFKKARRSDRYAFLAEKRLMHLATYDGTTGAYNETYFRKMLDECCKNQESCALVAFNIRGFKYINDTYGMKKADDMLCEIKYLLDMKMNEGEFFCRQSADLFYLLLKEENKDKLTERMNNIFEEIKDMVYELLDGHPISIYSGAVFVNSSPSPYYSDANMTYMMAALSHARATKSKMICVYDSSLHITQQMRYYIESHMQYALENEEYKLYLQPKMNLRTETVDGAEALVRWKPHDKEMIYPDQFIPLFEENGFCVQLDLYMVEQVCKLIRSWLDNGVKPITISVNQTKSLFVKEDYVNKLVEITKKYDVSPKYIILEILEGLAFENIDSLNKTIRKLNSVGFRVSMDDFGSGYSSLNTLGKLQINELKLDRMFLMDVMNDQKGCQSEVIASICSLARKLGIKTVAEGVETKESESVMRNMSCDYGQGYYYSKPIPINEFYNKYMDNA